MFSDDEYKQLIQANAHQPTVSEAQRYGVHFDYKDLCNRLHQLSYREKKLPVLVTHTSKVSFTKIPLSGRNEVRAHSNLRPKGSTKILLPRSLSPLLKSSSHHRLVRAPSVIKPVLRVQVKKS